MIERSLYWIPRIFTILALVFMLMFSFDSLDGNAPFSDKIAGFFMHNIPVMILAIILVIAWIRELPGGILFILAFIAASVYFKSFAGNPGSLVVILPFLVTGILFIIHHFIYRRNR